MTSEDGDFPEFSNEDRDKNVGGRQVLKIFWTSEDEDGEDIDVPRMPGLIV